MRRLIFTLATAACALIVNACQDATEPEVLAGSGGSGNDTECVGVLIGTFDNVVVPPGEVCILENSTVKGNVKALENSFLILRSTTVGGNVEGDKADGVQLLVPGGLGARNLVRGSIQVKEGDNEFAFVNICGTDLPNGNIQIEKMISFNVSIGGASSIGGTSCTFAGGGNTLAKGNIKVEENNPTVRLEIGGNSVGGNVQVFKNRGPTLKRVQNNTVGENLQCKENEGTFVGGPNTAGKAEGQCF